MPTQVYLANLLFDFLDESHIPYVIVGDVSGYDTTIRGDIDIVIPDNYLQNVGSRVHEFCRQTGGNLVQVLQHESRAWCFVLVWGAKEGGVQFLLLDICADYYRKGMLLLRHRDLLEGARKNDQGLRVPAPDRAFIYYLLKKIDKGRMSPSQFAYLRNQFLGDRSGGQRQMRRFWTENEVESLVDSLSNNGYEQLKLNIGALRVSLRKNLPFSPRSFWQERLRIIKRLLVPTGVFAAVLGTDGSGKSSIIREVESDLAPVFRRTRHYHLRPHLGRAATNGGPVTDPHGRPPRGILLSSFKVGYLWLDYSLGYVIDIYLRLIKSTLVLFDRYFYDLLVDPKRFRHGAPLWPVRFVSRFIPRPDLVILADAPAEVLHGRKQEVPLEETRRQRNAYLELVRGLPNGHVVDAAKPLHEVVRQVEGLVLDFLAKRTARRLGLPHS